MSFSYNFTSEKAGPLDSLDCGYNSFSFLVRLNLVTHLSHLAPHLNQLFSLPPRLLPVFLQVAGCPPSVLPSPFSPVRQRSIALSSPSLWPCCSTVWPAWRGSLGAPASLCEEDEGTERRRKSKTRVHTHTKSSVPFLCLCMQFEDMMNDIPIS